MPEVGIVDVTWEELQPGMVIAEQHYLMTPEDIRNEAEAYEDYNPIYGDAEFAAKSDMGSMVTPFYLTLGEFVFPFRKAGKRISINTIYSKSVRESFKPILVGDLITKKFSVYEKTEKRDKKFITWLIEYTNQRGELCQKHIRTSYWVGTAQPLLKFKPSGEVVEG